MTLSPLYRGQLLVHGMGFSPDHRTLLAVSIGSNSVNFIDTATNAARHTAYVGRASPTCAAPLMTIDQIGRIYPTSQRMKLKRAR